MDWRWFTREDLPMLNDWRLQRDLMPVELNELPSKGVVVVNHTSSIAAGFLRITEGLGIFDSMITNPEMPAETRHAALEVLFDSLLELAKIYSLKQLIGFSVEASMIERSKRFGFVESPYKLVTMKLG